MKHRFFFKLMMLFSLIEKLKKVKDFRRTQGTRHPLYLVLTLIVIGIMMGCLNYQDFTTFVKNHQSSLITKLKIPAERLPSYSTIRRVIMGVNWPSLIEIFREWAREIYPNKSEVDWLAIDGKCLRSTITNHQDNQQNFVLMVSLFSQTTGLVLDLKVLSSKNQSEISAAQELVRDCGQINKVFTLNALHCNQQLTQAIIENKNDYLIALKKNNHNLYKQIEEITKFPSYLRTNKTYDSSHGRAILRRVSVFKGNRIRHKSVKKLNSIIKVERAGFRESKFYKQVVYYVSSLSTSAKILAEKIRGHWGIENKLHWVKDVIFKEDKMKITDFQACTNFSILITIAINYFRSLGFFSIKEGQRWLGNQWEKLLI